jgi:hypothetical protein
VRDGILPRLQRLRRRLHGVVLSREAARREARAQLGAFT